MFPPPLALLNISHAKKASCLLFSLSVCRFCLVAKHNRSSIRCWYKERCSSFGEIKLWTTGGHVETDKGRLEWETEGDTEDKACASMSLCAGFFVFPGRRWKMKSQGHLCPDSSLADIYGFRKRNVNYLFSQHWTRLCSSLFKLLCQRTKPKSIMILMTFIALAGLGFPFIYFFSNHLLLTAHDYEFTILWGLCVCETDVVMDLRRDSVAGCYF